MFKRNKDLSQMDDLKLVADVLNGNEGAYTELVKRHQVRIYQMAQNLVGSADDADDLAQMVFVKAYRSLNRFQGDAQFSTWLYRICVNCCYDWMKAQKRWDLAERDEEWWGQLPTESILFGKEECPDQQVISREFDDVLDTALQKLTPEFRTVVVLREINGLSYDEIAELMECEVGTVKSRLFRARTQLRKILTPFKEAWQAA